MLEDKNCDGETQSIAKDGETGCVVNTYRVREVLTNKVTGENKSYGYLEEEYSGLRNSKHFLRQECLLACLKNYKDTQVC